MKTLVYVGPNCTKEIAGFVDRHDVSFLFEPLPEAADKLRSMFEHRAGVFVIQAACGEADGFQTFHRYNNGLSSSLFEVTPEAQELFSRADLSGDGSMNVMTLHLGNWLDRNSVGFIDTLILDAQGSDLTILRTMGRRLSNGGVGVIRTEADDYGFQHYNGPDNSLDEQIKFLSPFGYTPSIVSGTVDFHPDVIWQRVNDASEVPERLARATGGLCVA